MGGIVVPGGGSYALPSKLKATVKTVLKWEKHGKVTILLQVEIVVTVSGKDTGQTS
jgi:hypothetical protein